MPASVNSYSIASNMVASDPILTRGMLKRFALVLPAIATGSALAFTLEGFIGPVEGPLSGVSSATANWAPLLNAANGSRMALTTAGPAALVFPTDVVQAFDAVRLTIASVQAAQRISVLVQAKPG